MLAAIWPATRIVQAMRIMRTVAALVSLPGSMLYIASCVTPSSDAISETEVIMEATGMGAAEMGASRSVDESVEALDPLRIVRCRKTERGMRCMILCADAGISCAARLDHPYKPDVGAGDLGQCRRVAMITSCWYYYPNGDVCQFLTGGRRFCRYEGGAAD